MAVRERTTALDRVVIGRFDLYLVVARKKAEVDVDAPRFADS